MSRRIGRSSRRRELATRLAVLAVASVVALGLAELAARQLLRSHATIEQLRAYATPRQFAALPAEQQWVIPHRYVGYVLGPGFRGGRNRHNALGLRGEEVSRVPAPGRFRIVCLGGSTTYSSQVEDPADGYPARLEQALHEAGYRQVEVLNAGVPGYSSVESSIFLELKILDLEPDLIVVTHAANDVHARLVWPPEAYSGDNSGWRGARQIAPLPLGFEHSTLLRIVGIRLGWLPRFRAMESIFRPEAETSYTGRFHTQMKAGTYPSGPFENVGIERMLEENRPVYFARHLRDMVAVARAHGVEVVLSTFPYHPSWTGNHPMAHPAYRAAIEETNRVTLQVAAAAEVYAFDLAARVPADEALYTDGYHFTREGNELRGRLLAGMLIERGLIERVELPR